MATEDVDVGYVEAHLWGCEGVLVGGDKDFEGFLRYSLLVLVGYWVGGGREDGD